MTSTASTHRNKRRVRLGDLERDLGALPPVGDQPQRLLQQHARPVSRPALASARAASRSTADPLPRRRRLGQRTAQQNGRGLRRAAVHRRPRGLPQPRQHPAVAGRPHPGQVRGDPSRRGPVGVQQPGRAAMGPVTLAAAQRCLKRIADDRVNEPRRVTGGQHLGSRTSAVGQPRRGRHLHARDRRRMAQLAAVAQHGQRLRQAERAGIKAPHPGDHPPPDPLQPPGQQLARIQLGQRPAAGLGRPQQLGQVQRIAAARGVDGRAQLVARPAADRRAHHRAHGALAQQRRAQDRRRLRANRQQRCSHRRRIARPQRNQQPGRQPLQPRREVSQPAQRGLIGPVRVVDDDQQRPAGREVGHQPVQAMQHRKRTAAGRLPGQRAGQQRPHRRGGPGQQRLTFARARVRQAPLEQLPHHAEREARLQLRPAGPHDLVPQLPRPPACLLGQRRLADARPALDHQHPAAARQQQLNRGQLTLALAQPPHQTSLPPSPSPVHRAVRGDRRGGRRWRSSVTAAGCGPGAAAAGEEPARRPRGWG